MNNRVGVTVSRPERGAGVCLKRLDASVDTVACLAVKCGGLLTDDHGRREIPWDVGNVGQCGQVHVCAVQRGIDPVVP